MVVRPSLVCPNLNRISDEEAACLIQPFSLLEINNAIWECDGDKALGPDGINFHFIKRCWDGIQNDFFKLFDEFFVNASIIPGCTPSFLALIPKVNDPGGLGDYRPISLIGCVNKVISKVLVNRMKDVIQKLISEEQTTFLANRSILDGPLMLNEILAWLKRTKKKGMLFKVDIEKAYDTLNWTFLDSILSQMNFPSKWRSWIMAIVLSPVPRSLLTGSLPWSSIVIGA
ncbi:putative RNA-directed DNA polymerase [Helianthus annuus]|nr:putative RNA-directed DNA polymerase [Helianthus annuus]